MAVRSRSSLSRQPLLSLGCLPSVGAEGLEPVAHKGFELLCERVLAYCLHFVQNLLETSSLSVNVVLEKFSP